MIEVENLSKKFGNQWALEKTTWRVGEKRTLGLLGPNGAGKSTTMKIMTGLLCATDGRVCIDGADVFKQPVEAKRKIGFLPETPPVYEELTIQNFFNFICGLKSVPRSNWKTQVDQAIEKMNLQEVAYKPIGALSKGFRQRVGIGQAMIGDPAILILDEPSVGLDPQQVFELRNVIKKLKSDHTIVLSTHVLSEVQQICDDVVIMDKGVIKAAGPLQEVLQSKDAGGCIEMTVTKINEKFLEGIKKVNGVMNVMVQENKIEIVLKESPQNLDVFVKLSLEHNCGLLAVEKKQIRLEDVFIEVTK